MSFNSFINHCLINIFYFRPLWLKSIFYVKDGRKLRDHSDILLRFSIFGMHGEKTNLLWGRNHWVNKEIFLVHFFRFVMKRKKVERKSVARTNSKLWRKQQSGENSDTRYGNRIKEGGNTINSYADTLLLWLILITKQGSRGRGGIVRKIRVRLII